MIRKAIILLCTICCVLGANAQRTNWEKLLYDLNSDARSNGLEMSVKLIRPGDLAKRLTPYDCERLGYLRVSGGLGKTDLVLLTELAKRKQTINRQGKMVPARIDIDMQNAYIINENVRPFSNDEREITALPDIFRNCEGLRSVILPSNLTVIDRKAFYGCKNLEYVYIPDYVYSIEESAFDGCSRLYNVDINNRIEYIGKFAFNGCRDLEEFILPAKIKQIDNRAFAGTGIKQITLPEGLEILGDNVFGYTNIPEINIPASVNTMSGATFFSSNIKNIFVNPSNRNFSDIGGVLYSKDQKTLLYYPGKRSFAYTIPAGTECIGAGAFMYSEAPEIIIPASCTEIGEKAFYSSKITRVALPEGMTIVHKNAFEECAALQSVHLPATLQTISDEAFRGCKALNNVSIPNSVTHIGQEAFRACFAFTEIVIPASVKTIGEKAFYYCKNAGRIVMQGTMPPAVKKPTNYEKKVTLAVPYESVAAYKNAAGWSDIKNIIAQ